LASVSERSEDEVCVAVGLELRLDLNPSVLHLLALFIEPIEPIRMARAGVQVEAELEPYQLRFFSNVV
jgi:hypothetical protein